MIFHSHKDCKREREREREREMCDGRETQCFTKASDMEKE